MRSSKDKANRVRVVSPDNTSSDSGGFLDMLCLGGLDSLPNFCGKPDTNAKAVDTPAIVQDDIDRNDSSSQLGLKASIKKVGSFHKRSGSQKDLRDCSSDSKDQPPWRRRRQRQTNRDTRDPSPSIEINYKQSFSDKSSDGSISRELEDSPLLKDPPSTHKRSRSVPLEQLLNSRKHKVAKSNLQSSSSVGGGLGVASSNTKLLPFAQKHDEVVTSLIDDALQTSSDENISSAPIDQKRTTMYGSPLRKKGSPLRKKITTPQWMKNRSRKPQEERSDRGGFSVNTVNTADFFHPECNLYKEKGTSKDSSPSAVGREAAVAKLMEKLSLLSEIESGKYGKGADMLRSDAVAIPIQGFTGLEAIETRSIFTLRMGFVSLNYGIVLQWDLESKLVKQVVLVKMCRDDFLESEFSNSGSHTVITDSDEEDENSTPISVDSRTDTSPARALKPDSSVGQAYLAVSILNVKQLAPTCDHAHHGAWPWSSRATDPEPDSKLNESDHSDVYPYVRFVFGRNEHVTKPVKFDKGSITWNKRHRNSCLLPCPPEDQRWFAGQDDLIVEVRSKQISSDDTSTGGRFTHLSFFKEDNSSSRQKRKVTDDPLLAAVTVPLSSIIFDEEDNVKSDSKTKRVLSSVTCLFKNHRSKTNDGSPSNNITLPLPMKCCSKAPFGSISLSITMKTPTTFRGAPPLATPSVKSTPSPPRKRALKTKVASHQQVEGIELLPLTSFISSWVNDGADASSKSKNKAITMWTKRYDPIKKKWSNVNASIKSRSFKKPAKQKQDESFISQVVDRVMGKEKEQEKKSLFSVKPARDAMQKAKSDLNKSLHKVGDQVKERKKVVGSRINDSMNHIRQRPKQRAE